MKKLSLVLVLLIFYGCAATAQDYTPYPDSLPVWGFKDTVKSGSKTDPTPIHGTPARNYLNLLATRMHKFITDHFGSNGDSLLIFKNLSPKWDSLKNPDGALTLTMTTYRTKFNWSDYDNGGSGGAFTLNETFTGGNFAHDPLLEVSSDSSDDTKSVFTTYARFSGSDKSGVHLLHNGRFESFGIP